jgi:hypothetical protein
MEKCKRIERFIDRSAGDPRLSSVHVSLYLALVHLHSGGTPDDPVSVDKATIMQVAKISSRQTYSKCLQELHDYGYIRYVASYNHFQHSLVYFIDE